MHDTTSVSQQIGVLLFIFYFFFKLEIFNWDFQESNATDGTHGKHGIQLLVACLYLNSVLQLKTVKNRLD